MGMKEGPGGLATADTVPSLLSSMDTSESNDLQRWRQQVVQLGAADPRSRRSALSALHRQLLPPGQREVATTAAAEVAGQVLQEANKELFKCLGDTSEGCRELALRILIGLFAQAADLEPYLALFFPALMARLPLVPYHDPEAQLFVRDAASHEAYKRGKANLRQDKAAFRSDDGGEPSEEVRLRSCELLHLLARVVAERSGGEWLHPYFSQVIAFLHHHLQDPSPDVCIEASLALGTLASCPQYELGTKIFAVALVRSLLPLLRHKLAKVRAAGLSAIGAVVQVPDRARCKGAGSDAIVELVGYRPDNVLPVAAFYAPDVTINHLAELARDGSASVRRRLARTLGDWLLQLPDRQDHEARLVPYVLAFFNDPVQEIQELALDVIDACGEQHLAGLSEAEAEAAREQGGHDDGRQTQRVDGQSYPSPFRGRPSLAAQLYVRATTRRILGVVAEELLHWTKATRAQSARLLLTLLLFHERHVLPELPTLLPCLAKGWLLAQGEEGGGGGTERGSGDRETADTLLECARWIGRLVPPEALQPVLAGLLRETSCDLHHHQEEVAAAMAGLARAMQCGDGPMAEGIENGWYS